MALSFAALSVVLLAAAPAPPAPTPSPKLSKYQAEQLARFKESAPADEYFGRLKLSYLGMNNTFHDTGITSGDHTTDRNLAAKVALAEDALEDWGRKYPHDPELPRSYYLAVKVDRKIWLKKNQERAWLYMNRMVTLFPDTYFGKQMKADIAAGFTEHYYSDALTCSAVLAPGAAPATPTPSPPPSPTPVKLGPGLYLLVETPACIPLPTTAPSPPG